MKTKLKQYIYIYIYRMAPRLEHHVMLDGDSKKKGKKKKLKNSLGYIKGRDNTIVFGGKKKAVKADHYTHCSDAKAAAGA